MNVKITDSSVVFKISEEQLRSLISGNLLKQVITLSGYPLAISIVPNASTQALAGKPSLRLSFEPTQGFILYASESALHTIMGMGKNRTGVLEREEGIEVALRVDVKADSRG